LLFAPLPAVPVPVPVAPLSVAPLLGVLPLMLVPELLVLDVLPLVLSSIGRLTTCCRPVEAFEPVRLASLQLGRAINPIAKPMKIIHLMMNLLIHFAG
jgi:hypothetical protein